MEVEKAFKRLLVKNPFYGLFCLSLPKEITTKIPTLRVVKQGISCCLQINPDFWELHTDDEQLALLQHELGHICLQHMFMHESFADQKLFNISADCEVNSYIENLPKDGCTPEWLGKKIGKKLEKGLGTKKYYEAIQDYLNQQQQQAQAQNPQQPCNGGQGGSSQQSSQNSQSNSQNSSQNSQENQQQIPSSSSPSEAPQDNNPQKEEQQPSSPQENPQSQSENQEEGDNSQKQSQVQQEKREEEQEPQYPDEFEKELNRFDDHSSWDDFDKVPEATKQLMQNNINTILKNTAEQVEKMRGTIPGEFTELIEKLRQKKPEVFNWKAYFRRLLGSIYDVNIRSTRRKVSKRFDEAAGIQHKKKVSILVAIDTSGSVSKEELQEFFSEIDYAYKAGAKVTILQCDTKINSIDEYDGNNIPDIKGRGGTDFNPPVNYYAEHKKDYASLIYFTDGEAPLPDRRPQGMVWVISSCGYHQNYPGKAIYIPKQQSNNE